jgi:hypothetical protein
MKATSLLRNQHRRIEALIGRVGREAADSTVGRERQLRLTLVLQLVEELMTHLSLEDHVFLCSVADATGIRADTYRADQAQVRNAILQAVFAEEDDTIFAARVLELSLAFDQHVRVIERDVFPLADAKLKGEDLETMGTRMQTCWDAAIHGEGPLQRAHEHAAE